MTTFSKCFEIMCKWLLTCYSWVMHMTTATIKMHHLWTVTSCQQILSGSCDSVWKGDFEFKVQTEVTVVSPWKPSDLLSYFVFMCKRSPAHILSLRMLLSLCFILLIVARLRECLHQVKERRQHHTSVDQSSARVNWVMNFYCDPLPAPLLLLLQKQALQNIQSGETGDFCEQLDLCVCVRVFAHNVWKV